MKRPARKRAIGSPPWSGTDAVPPAPLALELDVAVVRRGPG
ncbi:hypothetical protein [Streptomyces canus]